MKIRKLLCFALICHFGILSAQFAFNDYPYKNNGTYKYFIGTDEPDANWYKPSFDDTGWNQGKGTIGYGDGDDSTVIPKTSSVYLRIHFNCNNKEAIKEANLFADYDDGYIAYLNGAEIVRVNLGKPYEFVSHDRLTDRSHEAVFYYNYERPVTGYYINTDTLAKYLKTGENILAVQVHNDSINGSDLTFNSHFQSYNPNYYNVWNNPYRFYAQIPLDSSRFPIVIINTDEFGFPLKKNRYRAKMSIIYEHGKEYYKPTDTATDYDNGIVSIEIRGNSTSDLPKQSFNIETQDSTGKNLNVSLMGMPAENDWVLYAPFADKSLIRNELAFYLGKILGYYEPRTQFCELIYNGEYRGLYVLTEKIKRDGNRVNVSQNSFDAQSGVEITGGYVLRFGDNDIYPQPEDRTDAQYVYLMNLYDDIRSILNRQSLGDLDNGFRKYFNEQYLIDYMLNNELMHNVDAYGSSTFYYKDRDDIDSKIKFGPIWDNDLSLGNTNYRNMPDDWMFTQNNYNINFTRFLSDTLFLRNFTDRWFELRENYFSDENLIHFIDSVSNAIKDSRIMNYKVWPVLSAPLLWPSYIPPSYDFEIDTMKQWIVMHAAWMDENISKIHYSLPPVSVDEYEITDNKSDIFVFPVPFNDYLNIRLKNHSSIKQVTLIDITGRIIYNEDFANISIEEYRVLGLDYLPKGTYVLTILNNEGQMSNRIVIK